MRKERKKGCKGEQWRREGERMNKEGLSVAESEQER